MPKVLVPIALGSEDLEAVTIIDLLRRAEFDVVVAGLTHGTIEMARGTKIVPDMSIDDALEDDYDMIAMPGGLPGAHHLRDDDRIIQRVKDMAAAGNYTCAVCAAPIVLAKAGVLEGKKATSFPGFLDQMDLPNTEVTGSPLEHDGKVITSRGPGTAMDFALELIEALAGKQKRDEVEERLVRPEKAMA